MATVTSRNDDSSLAQAVREEFGLRFVGTQAGACVPRCPDSISTPSTGLTMNATTATTATTTTALHPFYPVAILIPDYRPNTIHPIVLLLVFFFVLAAWLGAVSWFITKRKSVRQRPLPSSEWWWAMWFAGSGIIHITFEGYYAAFHSSMAGSNWIEAQMWKMYSLSDSRYIMSDPFVYIMEGCTALVWGPLCIALALYMIPAKSPYRHPTQMIVSLGQLYGLILYYAIPIVDEWVGGSVKAVSRPEWIFYWGEFVGLNAPWAIVPSYAIYASVVAIVGAFRIAAECQPVSTSSRFEVKDDESDEGLPFLSSN
ncbi:C-8,7 sterol isomerase [Phaffia rhodozyma]|uniref:C-8,7 sterol isomerase n=1 Tax=Phaffia rhodozyma TaxID=264483 RepID=A0A0F7SXM2_PHARH|nr:C-8,7 sterol isomerase [Phaffia rhodozyma]